LGQQFRGHHFGLQGQLVEFEDVTVDGADLQVVQDQPHDGGAQDEDEEQADGAQGRDGRGLVLYGDEVLEVLQILEVLPLRLRDQLQWVQRPLLPLLHLKTTGVPGLVEGIGLIHFHGSLLLAVGIEADQFEGRAVVGGGQDELDRHLLLYSLEGSVVVLKHALFALAPVDDELVLQPPGVQTHVDLPGLQGSGQAPLLCLFEAHPEDVLDLELVVEVGRVAVDEAGADPELCRAALADPQDLLGVAAVEQEVGDPTAVLLLGHLLEAGDEGHNLDAVDEGGQHLGESGGRQHEPLLGEGRHQSLVTVDLAFGGVDVSPQHRVVVFSVDLGHDARDVAVEQLGALVPDEVLDEVVGVNHHAELGVVARDDEHSGVGVLLVLDPRLVYLGGLLDVLEDDFRLLEVLHVVGLLVGDLQQELAVYGEQVDAVGVAGKKGVELTLELVLAASDLGAEVLEAADVGVGVHDHPPELNVVFGATLDVVLEAHQLVGVLEVLVYLGRLVHLLVVHFHHLPLDALQVERLEEPVHHVRATPRSHLSYRVHRLQRILDPEVVKQAQQELDFILLRELTLAFV
jgi:hypothetical protein